MNGDLGRKLQTFPTNRWLPPHLKGRAPDQILWERRTAYPSC